MTHHCCDSALEQAISVPRAHLGFPVCEVRINTPQLTERTLCIELKPTGRVLTCGYSQARDKGATHIRTPRPGHLLFFLQHVAHIRTCLGTILFQEAFCDCWSGFRNCMSALLWPWLMSVAAKGERPAAHGTGTQVPDSVSRWSCLEAQKSHLRLLRQNGIFKIPSSWLFRLRESLQAASLEESLQVSGNVS